LARCLPGSSGIRLLPSAVVAAISSRYDVIFGTAKFNDGTRWRVLDRVRRAANFYSHVYDGRSRYSPTLLFRSIEVRSDASAPS
jgi:hypothetical protein